MNSLLDKKEQDKIIESATTTDDKRAMVRYEAYLLVSDGDNFVGFLQDINETGAKILFSRNCVDLTKISQLVIDTKKYNLLDIKFKFRIVWQKDYPHSSLSEAGVAFVEPDFANISKLRLLLKALEEEGVKKVYYRELLYE